ncbi:hypothetical protein GUJ93_ZPchr0005g14838 [Zizania palustris]|uniref:Uncharacterized protein n=1 Tax=Zizania palustris TaxID=103762 RepID=A0A8J5VRR0_ZIZPA|nr:hypothetical protein GUJ93_ZPchr0005g14838 [Zizania palustris]
MALKPAEETRGLFVASKYAELSPIEEESEDATGAKDARHEDADAEEASGSNEGSDEGSDWESKGDSLDEDGRGANLDVVIPLEPLDEVMEVVDQSPAPEAFVSRGPMIRHLLMPGATTEEVVFAYFDGSEALARSDIVA